MLARIRSILRRYKKNTSKKDQYILNFGDFSLDTNKHELKKNGNLVDLTNGEFNMLNIFIKNIGIVLSRDKLLEIIKGYNYKPFDRSIDICIGRLRKKIESDPANPVYLKTVWGAGYLFSIHN